MLLGDQGKHRILGRLFSDDQLYRIIVPKRFTLHAYSPPSQIKAGFSDKVITSGNFRPDFTNEDIALVLQYRWPEELGDLKASDIDAVNSHVGGLGDYLDSEVDILSYNDMKLSDYCREKLYNDQARRDQILNDFKAELQEARRFRAAAVEDRFKRTEPGVLQYIIISRMHHALPWTSIAVSLNSLCSRPAGLESRLNEFDAGLVEEIYQLHAEARTNMFEDCVRRDWMKLSSTMLPSGMIRRKALNRGGLSPLTPAAMTLTESYGEGSDAKYDDGGQGISDDSISAIC